MKFLFFDIDGTLIDSGRGETRPSESALSALRKAQENGHYCFVCSGRNFAGLKNVMDLGMKGYICVNGADIIAEGYDAISVPIETELLKEMLELVEKLDGCVMISTRDAFYAGERDYEFMREFAKEAEDDTENQVVKRLVHYSFDEPAHEVDVSFLNSEAEQEFMRLMNPRLEYISTSASYGRDGGTSGEVTMKGITKGSAVEKIVRLFHGDMKDTIGFGDSMNDYSMIKMCATGVAMGNGADALKQAADVIADDIQNDGLYKIMKELGLFA